MGYGTATISFLHRVLSFTKACAYFHARGGGVGVGGIPIHKISLRDVPPFKVWFFDRPLINRVSNSKIFEDSRKIDGNLI